MTSSGGRATLDKGMVGVSDGVAIIVPWDMMMHGKDQPCAIFSTP
jgi:hypothetical protein